MARLLRWGGRHHALWTVAGITGRLFAYLMHQYSQHLTRMPHCTLHGDFRGICSKQWA